MSPVLGVPSSEMVSFAMAKMVRGFNIHRTQVEVLLHETFLNYSFISACMSVFLINLL
jgi:hypothetical protein